MAKKGRAGPALAIAAIGSFIGGTVATIALVLLALPLASVALAFGPPEFFALMVLGLSLVTGLASRSLVRALISAIFGLLIAMIGIDPIVGSPRFTFGFTPLLGGLNIVPIAMGLFGLGEIFLNIERKIRPALESRVGSLMPTRADLAASSAPIARGTGIGFLLGLIPGVGSVIPTFMSYAVEKRLSKTPEKFGTGMIEGVAGPETANNAYVNASLIPLFTLGIPASPTLAVMMGAFLLNGLQPGPFLFVQHPDFIWAVIASLYIGNVMLLVLNLPLIPIWVALLKIPYPILMTIILLFAVVGTYSISNSVVDIAVLLVFGILGYVFKKLDFPLAPIILTVILGPLMERGLRQSLQMSNGSFEIFLERPLAASVLALAVAFVVLSAIPGIVRRLSRIRADSEI